MKHSIGFLLVIIVAVAVGYFLATRLVQPSAQAVAVVATTTSPGVQVTSATIHEETSQYLINVTYPQFGIPAIDADIKSKIDAAVAELKASPANPADSATPQNSLDGSFDSVYVGPDVVSAKLILSEYTGGAHPNTLLSGVNYDRASGRQLLQSDAFKMIGMTVEQVSSSSTAQLRATIGDSIFAEGANTNPENFSSFIISADKVTFIFQPYQVAAYSAGPQEVSFQRR